MIRRILTSALVRNAGFLAAAQLAGLLAPLLSVPWLSRVLGVDAWGTLLYVQSLSMGISAIVEYGFALSATRSLAPVREQPVERRRQSTAVFSAKILLSVPCAVVFLGCFLLLPDFADHPSMVLAGFLLALLQGFHPLWYFQAMERLGIVAGLDLASRFLALGAILLLVRSPEGAASVLWIQVAFQCLSTGICTWLQVRSCDGLGWHPREGVAALKDGAGMFLFRASVTLYTSANAFLLGTFSVAAQVAFFGGAEKIAKAATSLLSPISQAVYPRINALLGSSPEKASRLAWVSFAGTQALAWIGFGLLAWLAPWIVRLALGEGFEPAATVLRILALLLPLVAASNTFGMQILLPRRKDGAFNGVIVAAGALNIALSVVLAGRYGAVGMAVAVVGAEALVAAAMGVTAWRCLRIESKGAPQHV